MVNNVGRPSKYTPQLGERICAEIAAGRSVRAICEDEWCPVSSTIFYWLAGNKQFSEQYAQAREQQAELFAEQIIEIADDARNDFMERETEKGAIVLCDHENINRSRLRVDARKWVVSKILPKKYGDSVKVGDMQGNPLGFFVTFADAGDKTTTKAG